jgi:hypothetical protein
MYDLNFDNKNEFINCLVRNIWPEDDSKEIFAGVLYDFVIQKVNKYNNKSIGEILELSVDGF